MDIRFAALADYAAVDPAGRFNIIGLFRDLYVPSFPAQIGSLHVAISFSVNPAEAGAEKTLRIVLQDEDGASILNADSQLVAPTPERGRQGVLNVCFGVHNLAFQKEGAYQVSVLVNGETKTVLPFDVYLAPTPGA